MPQTQRRSDVQAFVLLAKTMLEHDNIPHQNVRLVVRLAKMFGVTQKQAMHAYVHFIKNNQENTATNANMGEGRQLVDPQENSFDEILKQGYRYDSLKSKVSTSVDMKNYEQVDLQHIAAKTKSKRGMAEFIQLLREQKNLVSRKTLSNIYEGLKTQLRDYTSYVKDLVQ